MSKIQLNRLSYIVEARAEKWQDAVKFGTPVEWYTPLQ